MQTRLQKILSTAGISSRRAAETLIVEGRVTVNGKPVTELGSKADPDADDIRVDGRRVKPPGRRRYILMYKPRGYITSRMDPEQRPTVNDLLLKGGVREYIYPVGRLDYESFKLSLKEPSVTAAVAALTAEGLEPDYVVANGGLDANWFDKHGVPTITIGAGQAEIHTIKEYVNLPEFEKGCHLGILLATLDDE